MNHQILHEYDFIDDITATSLKSPHTLRVHRYTDSEHGSRERINSETLVQHDFALLCEAYEVLATHCVINEMSPGYS